MSDGTNDTGVGVSGDNELEGATPPVGAISFAATATTTMSPPEQADAALLRAMRRGDERAFEELFTRHYARVYGVAVRISGDAQEAEELAQDVFLKLYRRPLSDTDDANVAGWLYRVATNDAFNAVRARRRRRGWLHRFVQREPSGTDVSADPLSIVAGRDEAGQVRAALAQLPERQRNALVLRASGLTYAEVADALEVKPTSVGTLLARAEQALRTVFLQHTGEE
jgi:RNA polymerase sigma-70 factor (ECF subfamily)